jgi:hypothetical protein
VSATLQRVADAGTSIRDLWTDVLGGDLGAGVQQTPAWVDAICATGGYVDATRIYRTSDGRHLVLPMVRRVWHPVPVVESLPSAWGAGGLLSSDGAVRAADVTAVWADVTRRRITSLHVRPEAHGVPAWDAATLGARSRVRRQQKSVVCLDGGFDATWGRFRGEARTAIRKAERAGVVVTREPPETALPEFYSLYVRWTVRRARERRLPVAVMRARAERTEPFRKFVNVAFHLGDACRLWLARHEGRAVAAAISLVYGRHATYWRGYSDKALAGPTRANNLLHRWMIEDACLSGARSYNMGWSGTDSLLRFKRSLGAQPIDYPVYSYERFPAAGTDGPSGAARAWLLERTARRTA